MILRYSFPVARHGRLVPVSRYVDCEFSPTKDELLEAFREKREEALRTATVHNDTDISWSDLKNWDGCIYALEHLRSELPIINPTNLTDAVIFCDTELEVSNIRISVLPLVSITRPLMRLVAGE